MQKYPRGSRGSPAKGVVWENRSTSSNLVFCAKKRQVLYLSFFGVQDSSELVNCPRVRATRQKERTRRKDEGCLC